MTDIAVPTSTGQHRGSYGVDAPYVPALLLAGAAVCIAFAATRHNAELEGVTDRVALETGDMRELPFDDASFDVIVTNAAVHNLKKSEDRATALAQMWRVTRSGGRLVLADIAHTDEYEQVLTALGATDVTRRSAGIQGWFGNPMYATRVVTATKP